MDLDDILIDLDWTKYFSRLEAAYEDENFIDWTYECDGYVNGLYFTGQFINMTTEERDTFDIDIDTLCEVFNLDKDLFEED